jgi:tetratricopeptide (TPR) repeat protein
LAKSLKNSQSQRSRSANFFSSSKEQLAAAGAIVCLAAVCFFSLSGHPPLAEAAPPAKKLATRNQETYQDLITKAQNLTLQRDRLQASQILLRAIAREPKTSQGYKELTKALQELTGVFYTERAQSLFIAGEANLQLKPKEAIESFQEALRLEYGNVTVLKGLARAHLVQGECDKADGFVKSAEALDPYSAEIFLLRLQTWDCSKATQFLEEKLFTSDAQLVGVEPYVRGLQMRDLIRRGELKKAKALLDKWSAAAKDYPEVAYWTFELSKAPVAAGAASSGASTSTSKSVDKTAAQRYVQLCQNLTPRKRKSYNLDVELCKAKETVEAFLKESSDEE